MYTPRQGRRAMKMAGQHVALGVIWSRALLVKAIVIQASVAWKCPQLHYSRGCPRSPSAHQPCAREPGAGLALRTADIGWSLGPPGLGRQALSSGNRLRMEASVIAALISSPSGS